MGERSGAVDADDVEALQWRVQQLQDLVDNSSALMFVKDLDGRYLVVNRCFAARFGVPVEEIVGRTDAELFPSASAAVYSEHDQRVLTSGSSVEVEEPFASIGGQTDPDDDRRWLSLKFPLLGGDGRPYALGGISTDITDRKRAETRARRALAEAEEANRSKSEFLSRISHELRTPLNAIIGFAQILRDDATGSGGRELADHVLDSGRHLLALVNDVLDITWIDAGAPGLATGPVPAAQPLHEALQIIRPLARARDVEVASDLHEALHRDVVADPQRLRQVFLNLLGNAVKFNRPGGAVRVVCRASTEERGRLLTYLVTDTGPGISDHEREQLFTPFSRLPSAAGVEGTGLGLALSRRLVEEMGGRLDIAHSAPGEGSTFFVELPLAAVARPAGSGAADALAEPLGGLGAGQDEPDIVATVLHIEDTYANLRLVEEVFARHEGIELLSATSGSAGLAVAAERAADVDLVLLDLNLADMGGIDVIAALRASPATAHLPVIVVSADATPSRVEELRSTGIVDYLTKPLDIHELVRAVRAVVRT